MREGVMMPVVIDRLLILILIDQVVVRYMWIIRVMQLHILISDTVVTIKAMLNLLLLDLLLLLLAEQSVKIYQIGVFNSFFTFSTSSLSELSKILLFYKVQSGFRRRTIRQGTFIINLRMFRLILKIKIKKTNFFFRLRR